MLTPNHRSLFIDALRPPLGYEFDCGIGTTFSLDLYTLLITPLSLSLYDAAGSNEDRADPIILMDSIRRYTEKLTIFCQSGRIGVPASDNQLFRWLENMVVQVQAPRGGVFHPKLWVLRYVADGKPSLYRVLNLSRNLTFDKSWDLILRLEGNADRPVADQPLNQPLSAFLAALPGLATSPVSSQTTKSLEILQNEVGRVSFSLPEGFEKMRFVPLGIEGLSGYHFNQWINRFLIISPFLSDQYLQALPPYAANNILVAREEALDVLEAPTRQRFAATYVLDDIAAQGLAETGTSSAQTNTNPDDLTTKTELSGLHAKLFVGDLGWDAVWLIGSANATTAAFQNNVEFMVELKGKKSRVGIDKILGTSGDKDSFNALLIPYLVKETQPIDENSARLEKLLEDIRGWLINAEMRLAVSHNAGDTYDLVLSARKPGRKIKGNYQISVWPISLTENFQKSLDPEQLKNTICFKALSLLTLTPFLAFEIKAQAGRLKNNVRFVLKLPLDGMPVEREDALFSAIISDKAQFLRYLRLLLADDDLSELVADWSRQGAEPGGRDIRWDEINLPLLEQLVRALSRNPERKIDHITEVIERLKRTQKGRDILSGEFELLWKSVLLARSRL